LSKVGVDIVGAFCCLKSIRAVSWVLNVQTYLDIAELTTVCFGSCPINISLAGRNVTAWNSRDSCFDVRGRVADDKAKGNYDGGGEELHV